jgi:hypothetical protein
LVVSGDIGLVDDALAFSVGGGVAVAFLASLEDAVVPVHYVLVPK